MRHYYTDESEVFSGPSNPVRASKGLGDGFNSHAGTGSIASATEQRKQAERGESAFLRNVLASADFEPAVKAALQVAVITEVLRTLGVSAFWSVRDGSAVEAVDPRNAIDTLARSGSTLKVELTTELPAERVVNLLDEVHASCISHLENIDQLDGAHPGQGKAFFALMAASSVFAMAIGRKGSALSRLVEDAKKAIRDAERAASGSIFAVSAADLESCPVCNSRTGRTDMVCPQGHRTTAAIRAAQEQFVLDAARTAALQAGLVLVVQAKVKGSARFELNATPAPAILAKIQDVSAKVSFNSPGATGDITAAWASLAQTTTMRKVLDAAVATASSGAEVRTRVLRAVSDAISKAANSAADVIGYEIALDLAHRIYDLEQARRDAEWRRLEDEYRKELVRKAAGPLDPKQLRKFVDDTNKRRRFAGQEAQPRHAKNKARKGPRSKRRGRKGR
jgi:hypothetical protein